MWNEMMHTGVNATLEATSTDYRDRVDRIFAAMVANGLRPEKIENSVKIAMQYIDAIDEVLKEREALAEVKK